MRIAVSEDAVYREIDGEGVVLDLASGVYFGLNEAGARIWALLAQGKSREDIVATLLEEYEVPPEQLGKDVDDLLQRLVEKGLLRRHA